MECHPVGQSEFPDKRFHVVKGIAGPDEVHLELDAVEEREGADDDFDTLFENVLSDKEKTDFIIVKTDDAA